jgi:hypothetical protein
MATWGARFGEEVCCIRGEAARYGGDRECTPMATWREGKCGGRFKWRGGHGGGGMGGVEGDAEGHVEEGVDGDARV